ncbi:hypothetical protein ACHAP1_009055 [Verticillium nonalfalfae]
MDSNHTAEEDVCFPLQDKGRKDQLYIDFDYLENFLQSESAARALSKQETVDRSFADLRPQGSSCAPDGIQLATLDGDILDMPSESSMADDNKEKPTLADELRAPQQPPIDKNRFSFFSSAWESTIHAQDFGDLVLPGEDVRGLFALPPNESDGVWWLNVNNPTKEEVQAICKAFGIHPLTIEDITTQEAREKIELFPSYYFASFRSFQTVEEDDGQDDDIVDCFAPIIRKIELEADSIEDEVFVIREGDSSVFLRSIGRVRKNCMALMRLLGGKADVLRGFTKRCNENYKVTPRMDIGLYLGDIQDHVVTMVTNLGHFEKILSRSHSNYLAQLSINNIAQGTDTNRVLSKITFLASILVPMNLVSGLFGMNVRVPFQDGPNVIPFFTIMGSLFFFCIVILVWARRARYI